MRSPYEIQQTRNLAHSPLWGPSQADHLHCPCRDPRHELTPRYNLLALSPQVCSREGVQTAPVVQTDSCEFGVFFKTFSLPEPLSILGSMVLGLGFLSSIVVFAFGVRVSNGLKILGLEDRAKIKSNVQQP